MENITQKNALIEGMVSIIVPVYNAEKYVQKCIESAIRQSYANIEVLLIDDGSTDGSGNLCDEYALKDKRVKAIHKKNGGPSDARNVGIERSRGEFIFFMDADDYIVEDTLGILIKSCRESSADLAVGDFEIKHLDTTKDDNSRFIFLGDVSLANSDLVSYVKGYLEKPTGYSLFIYTWGKLFRSEIIKTNNIRFDTNLHVFEDIAFNFNYLIYTKLVSYVRRHLYIYIIYGNYNGASAKIVENPTGFKYALQSIESFLKSKHVPTSLSSKLIGNAYAHFSIRSIMQMVSMNKKFSSMALHSFVNKIVKDSDISKNLRFYTPTKGDSRIIPILMRLRLVHPIIWVCRYKAYKRYRKISLKKG